MTFSKALTPPNYRKIPNRLNLAGELLDRIEERGFQEKKAFVWKGGNISFSTFTKQVNRLAHGLVSRGIRPAMPVLIRMHNCQEFATSFLALIKIGALPVIQNSLLGQEEIDYVISHSGAQAAITLQDLASPLKNLAEKLPQGIFIARNDIDNSTYEDLITTASDKPFSSVDTFSDDPAFCVYTSGTTGKPKGIVHAHRWVIALGDSNAYRLPPLEHDHVYATGEWSFISALGHNVIFPLRNGVTGVILEDRPTPENVLTTIQDQKVSVVYSVATVYRRILATKNIENKFDLSSLRVCNATGEALEAATWKEFKERIGCEILEHYGVSEMQMVIGQSPHQPVRPGSIGRQIPGTMVSIRDENYEELPKGEVGHFLIASDNPGFFLGYHNDTKKTQEVVHNGWYHTGDLAWQDEEGYFWIAGRSDDCFKSRGIFISPYEIENVLREHPSIAEACVVAVPDQEIGNKIRAVCVLKEGIAKNHRTAEEVRSNIKDRIARYKVPHLIDFVDTLPKSPVGKVLRRELTS